MQQQLKLRREETKNIHSCVLYSDSFGIVKYDKIGNAMLSKLDYWNYVLLLMKWQRLPQTRSPL
jgi:hypothetical protein